MWERHATKKGDQQRQTISGMGQGEVEDLGAWTREAVKYLGRFVPEQEVKASREEHVEG